MIFIKEQSLNKAWRNAVKELIENGYTPQDNRFTMFIDYGQILRVDEEKAIKILALKQ